MGEIISSKEIGLKIRQLRQQAGFSQERLAELIGVTFQQVQKYESGHTTLSVLKLQQIAKALNSSASSFFDCDPFHQIRLTNEENQLIEVFRRIRSKELRTCALTLMANINKRKNR